MMTFLLLDQIFINQYELNVEKNIIFHVERQFSRMGECKASWTQLKFWIGALFFMNLDQFKRGSWPFRVT